MRKGLTLIEIVVSAALISIVIIAISALNLTNIKTNNINKENDEAFNIARSVCEMFKSECELVPNKSVVAYIDRLDDINDSISGMILIEPDLRNKDFEQIMNSNLNKKKYALLIETSLNNQFNVLKVTVISMNELRNTIDLIVVKQMERV